MKKCILCLLLCLTLLASCVAGGSKPSDTLMFNTPVGDSFKVNLYVEKNVINGNGGLFQSKKSLQDIQKEILEKNSCNVAIYEDNLLIEKTIDQISQIVTISKFKVFIFMNNLV